MLGEEILYLPVSELGEKIRSREISPVELTESYLERVDRLDPTLHAFVTVSRDLALAQAREAEKEISSGNYRGPLHGVPYGAKDLLATKDFPTTWGAKPLENQQFDYDATVILKLREAGAIFLGKLAMIELAGGERLADRGGEESVGYGQVDLWILIRLRSGGVGGNGGLCDRLRDLGVDRLPFFFLWH
jgi:aspartyl-tRNA(Asn)/glutamyl-tRNA(Gln) amidotransferase subunit A